MRIQKTALVVVYALFTIYLMWLPFRPTQARTVEFLNDSCIRPQKYYSYTTCHPINVKIDGFYVEVPANFDTDLASIPRWYWSILSPAYTSFIAPSILHDYLYTCTSPYTRKQIDEIFYYALLSKGVSRYTAVKMYTAVRVFGGRHYKKIHLCLKN